MRPLQSWPPQEAQHTEKDSRDQISGGPPFKGEFILEDHLENTPLRGDLQLQEGKRSETVSNSPAMAGKKQAVEALYGPLVRAMRELSPAPAVISRMTSRRKAQKQRFQANQQLKSPQSWNPKRTARKSQGDGGNRHSHAESITASSTGSKTASKTGAHSQPKTPRQLSLQFEEVVESIQSSALTQQISATATATPATATATPATATATPATATWRVSPRAGSLTPPSSADGVPFGGEDRGEVPFQRVHRVLQGAFQCLREFAIPINSQSTLLSSTHYARSGRREECALSGFDDSGLGEEVLDRSLIGWGEQLAVWIGALLLLAITFVG